MSCILTSCSSLTFTGVPDSCQNDQLRSCLPCRRSEGCVTPRAPKAERTRARDMPIFTLLGAYSFIESSIADKNARPDERRRPAVVESDPTTRLVSGTRLVDRTTRSSALLRGRPTSRGRARARAHNPSFRHLYFRSAPPPFLRRVRIDVSVSCSVRRVTCLSLSVCRVRYFSLYGRVL